MSVSNESDGNDDCFVCDNMFNLFSPLQLMVIFLVLNLVVSCEEMHLKMLGLDCDKRENERKNGW